MATLIFYNWDTAGLHIFISPVLQKGPPLLQQDDTKTNPNSTTFGVNASASEAIPSTLEANVPNSGTISSTFGKNVSALGTIIPKVREISRSLREITRGFGEISPSFGASAKGIFAHGWQEF